MLPRLQRKKEEMTSPIYIRHVAAAGEITAQAVRYYERLGLLKKPRRTDSGYRIYTRDAIGRVRFIKDAQKLGLNLGEIRVIIQMKCALQPPCDCVRDMLKGKLARIEKHIAEMDAMRRKLLKVLHASNRLPPLPHEDILICPLIEKSATETPHHASD